MNVFLALYVILSLSIECQMLYTQGMKGNCCAVITVVRTNVCHDLGTGCETRKVIAGSPESDVLVRSKDGRSLGALSHMFIRFSEPLGKTYTVPLEKNEKKNHDQ